MASFKLYTSNKKLRKYWQKIYPKIEVILVPKKYKPSADIRQKLRE